MDSYIKLAIRKMKTQIEHLEWDDEYHCMFCHYDNPFICIHAYCVNKDGLITVNVSFNNSTDFFRTHDDARLLEKLVVGRHPDEVRAKARAWLLENVERAFEELLNFRPENP